MPDRELLEPRVLALKAGLSPWHGELLEQLRRIADALEGANENPGVLTGRRKKDSSDA